MDRINYDAGMISDHVGQVDTHLNVFHDGASKVQTSHIGMADVNNGSNIDGTMSAQAGFDKLRGDVHDLGVMIKQAVLSNHEDIQVTDAIGG